MSTLVVSVTNFLLKLVVGTLILWLAGQINPFLFLSSWVAFTTAIVIGVVGSITDLTILPQIGNGRAVGMDFIINTFLIWLVPSLWHGTSMSFTVAIVCSVIFALLEYSTHIFMLRSERLMARTR